MKIGRLRGNRPEWSNALIEGVGGVSVHVGYGDLVTSQCMTSLVSCWSPYPRVWRTPRTPAGSGDSWRTGPRTWADCRRGSGGSPRTAAAHTGVWSIQYSTVQCNTVQYSTVQYSTVQYSAAQYSTVQYSTVQYSAAHRPGVWILRGHLTSCRQTRHTGGVSWLGPTDTASSLRGKVDIKC